MKTLWLIASLVAATVLSTNANAQMVFYYEPETGNVSLDTSETHNGGELVNRMQKLLGEYQRQKLST